MVVPGRKTEMEVAQQMDRKANAGKSGISESIVTEPRPTGAKA